MSSRRALITLLGGARRDRVSKPLVYHLVGTNQQGGRHRET